MGALKGFALILLVAVVVASTEDEEKCPRRKLNWSKYKPGVGGGFPKTTGSVWPLPQSIKTSPSFMVVQPDQFKFQAVQFTCDLMDNAFARYYKLIFSPPRGAGVIMPLQNNSHSYKQIKQDPNFAGLLTSLHVSLDHKCDQWPKEDMDEQYVLKVNTDDLPGNALLYAQSIWGILRGLETFSQLIYRTNLGLFAINTTSIRDFPRFSFRGIMLDTSRHYVHKSLIKENLEAMAENKLNVFHWHIVDDQSFPYESSSFPTLSEQGAFNPYTHTYTLDDIAEIIEFARVRGIRVIPEFDSPGHTQSWGLGLQGLLTQCYRNDSGKLIPDGFGPIDPTVESTYDTLKKLFSEIVHVFPDSYVHLGGDEVSYGCWQSNPNVQKFMEKMKFGSDYSKLEQYYMQRLLDIVKSFPTNNNYVIWQEVIDNNATVKPDTIVEVWKSPYEKEMATITNKGYRVLLSACWYLNYINYGIDWPAYYLCDPQSFNGTDKQKKLVMGGEACMWGEYVDGINLTPRLWPRASAVAERLWSDRTVNDSDSAAPRLEEHRCRMLARGINAEPSNGPGYCNVDHLIQKHGLFP